MATGNLTRRLAFSVVAIPAAVGIAYLGGWYFAGLIALVAVLGVRELYDFAAAQGIDPLRRMGMFGAAAIPLGTLVWVRAPYAYGWPQSLLYSGALWLITLMGIAAWRRGPAGRPLVSVAVTVFGAVYAGGLPAFAIALRHWLGYGPGDEPWAGTALLFFPLVLTWVGDTAAYAGGTAFGGPKLAPVLSPNKTWSGAACGLAGTLLAAAGYSTWVLRPVGQGLPLLSVLVAGFFISAAGQVGDLAESSFKREIGVKDSSALIPGHGGVLDRFDALYFVLPVTAALYSIFFGLSA
ncbi:MAG: phosphatidate cytidylyltransferase [Gemmatimonadales bacterium]|nr:phosphatidate cytidylyltransferase [Gemmatimonadales bacterium]